MTGDISRSTDFLKIFSQNWYLLEPRPQNITNFYLYGALNRFIGVNGQFVRCAWVRNPLIVFIILDWIFVLHVPLIERTGLWILTQPRKVVPYSPIPMVKNIARSQRQRFFLVSSRCCDLWEQKKKAHKQNPSKQ